MLPQFSCMLLLALPIICLVGMMSIASDENKSSSSLICPDPDEISPCECKCRDVKSGESCRTAKLICYYDGLNDSRTNEILEAYLATPDVSPLLELDLSENQLTKIPSQLTRFPHLVYVDFKLNNITYIQSGSFNFSDPVIWIHLEKNELNHIEPGAFQGAYGKGGSQLNAVQVHLGGNNLTRFDSNVYRDLLEQMAPFIHYRPYIDLDQNEIDCDSDVCHLAWLIRDNRHLLGAVHRAKCSNGTDFNELNPDEFQHCPVDDTPPRKRDIIQPTSGAPHNAYYSLMFILNLTIYFCH